MKLKPFRLERYFAEYEFAAPYLLCCSDCESLSVADLLRFEPGAWDRLSALWLGYTESQGGHELRSEIAALYRGITPEEILVHSGAEEAIFNFMHVALETGDEIIVQAPYYQSLGEVARSLGAKVTEWRGDPNHNWELDLQFLTDHLTDKTKVVVVNFPHNPTGYLPTPDLLHDLARLSDTCGFFVFSDEVYRGLEYDPGQRLPSFAELTERGISLGVMSKTYGLAGLRIGWIATHNRKLSRELSVFKDYTTICNSAPSEFLAALALRHSQRIVERNLGIIRDNLSLLGSFFSRHRNLFVWEKPKAGPIAFPRYLGESVAQFCDSLRRRTGVLLLPGTVYGDDYDAFRMGFGRRSMSDGLRKLEAFLVDS